MSMRLKEIWHSNHQFGERERDSIRLHRITQRVPSELLRFCFFSSCQMEIFEQTDEELHMLVIIIFFFSSQDTCRRLSFSFDSTRIFKEKLPFSPSPVRSSSSSFSVNDSSSDDDQRFSLLFICHSFLSAFDHCQSSGLSSFFFFDLNFIFVSFFFLN